MDEPEAQLVSATPWSRHDMATASPLAFLTLAHFIRPWTQSSRPKSYLACEVQFYHASTNRSLASSTTTNGFVHYQMARKSKLPVCSMTHEKGTVPMRYDHLGFLITEELLGHRDPEYKSCEAYQRNIKLITRHPAGGDLGEANPCLLRKLLKLMLPLMVDITQTLVPDKVEYDLFDMVVRFGAEKRGFEAVLDKSQESRFRLKKCACWNGFCQ